MQTFENETVFSKINRYSSGFVHGAIPSMVNKENVQALEQITCIKKLQASPEVNHGNLGKCETIKYLALKQGASVHIFHLPWVIQHIGN